MPSKLGPITLGAFLRVGTEIQGGLDNRNGQEKPQLYSILSWKRKTHLKNSTREVQTRRKVRVNIKFKPMWTIQSHMILKYLHMVIK